MSARVQRTKPGQVMGQVEILAATVLLSLHQDQIAHFKIKMPSHSAVGMEWRTMTTLFIRLVRVRIIRKKEVGNRKSESKSVGGHMAKTKK